MSTNNAAVSSDKFDREALGLMATAVRAVNHMAKHFKDKAAQRRMYETKHSLVSWALESDLPGLDVTWQRQPNGDTLVLVHIGSRATVHCPFERLSASARCKVVRRAGPG